MSEPFKVSLRNLYNPFCSNPFGQIHFKESYSQNRSKNHSRQRSIDEDNNSDYLRASSNTVMMETRTQGFPMIGKQLDKFDKTLPRVQDQLSQSFKQRSISSNEPQESKVQVRNQHIERMRNKSNYDSSMNDGLAYMEKVYNYKQREMNHRSLAMTGKKIENDFNNNPEDKDHNRSQNYGSINYSSPTTNKRYCDMTRYVKSLKDSRIHRNGKIELYRPNLHR